MMQSDSNSKQSSSSEPDGAEIVYSKDNVTIHPTQFASERISGRLKLIKQGSSLFMVISITSLCGFCFYASVSLISKPFCFLRVIAVDLDSLQRTKLKCEAL